MNTETWTNLNEIPEPLIDYENDTDLEVEMLQSMDWKFVGTERSNYSAETADTYLDSTETYAKKVYSDGFVSFYELA